jgi:hypothetical protein
MMFATNIQGFLENASLLVRALWRIRIAFSSDIMLDRSRLMKFTLVNVR